MIYIGAEEIWSPLGQNCNGNFQAVAENRSGISLFPQAGFNGETLPLARITALPEKEKFGNLVERTLQNTIDKIDSAIVSSDRTIVIISSTKGDLDTDIRDPFGPAVATLLAKFSLAHEPLIVSNACISGVLAINAGRQLIASGFYDHAIVVGCDVVSNFVLYGFQSLFAVSAEACMPFDAARNGVTLGEGCASVVLSRDKSIYHDSPLVLYAGTSANDANHISGPSRTGEGLFRSVKKTLESNGISAGEIDFISAHGTATVFNDEMESIAFDRLGLNNVPLNSLKGYFGHTLGAAGVIETAISMQMMRKDLLVKSLGYQQSGTSKSLNMITDNRPAPLKVILKTASGFGGCNASLVFRTL